MNVWTWVVGIARAVASETKVTAAMSWTWASRRLIEKAAHS
jgi:hypothetical protein